LFFPTRGLCIFPADVSGKCPKIGGVAEFNKLKRKLQAELSEELYLFPEGNTDSEWAFALFLQMLSKVMLSFPLLLG
jgi:hypothetical protein